MSRKLLCLLMCGTLCGCGATEVPPAALSNVKPAAAASKDKSAPKDAQQAGNDTETSSAEATSEEPQQAEYQPPFPDRENLFLAPKRSASSTKAPGSVEQSVELLGFANVEGPRVILSINGNVVPMPEGGKEAGIEVISIQPPAVVLQRDRERWQATLEN
jgi:hypothetical protein